MGDDDDFSEGELQRISADLGVAVRADSLIADLAEALHTKLGEAMPHHKRRRPKNTRTGWPLISRDRRIRAAELDTIW